MSFVENDIILCQNEKNKRMLFTYSDIYSLYRRVVNIGDVVSATMTALLHTMCCHKWITMPLGKDKYIQVTYCKSINALKQYCSSADFSIKRCGKNVLRKKIGDKTVIEVIGGQQYEGGK